MIIGFDAKRALFNRSGLGNYSRSILRLLSLYYPDNKYILFGSGNNKTLFQESGNQTIVGPSSGIYSASPSLWRSYGIQHQIKNQKLDIFHGLSNELPFGIKKTGVKSVVTIHDLIFLRYPEYYPLIDRIIYSLKFKHACRAADKIIATSEATKQDIIYFFGTEKQKIEVVYQTCNPVFRKTVTPAIKDGIRKKYNLPEKFILYLGTIELRKNALSLIKAYLSQKIDIPLLIAGKPTDYMIEINEFLKRNPSGNSILFRHAIESDDLPALYQSAEVFVYPSVFEGFGIPILEALCSGVPVITSTGSCFSETGGDAALYCDPLDIIQIGNCLSTVLNNADTRKSMVEKGLKHSELFSEANVAYNMMNVYLHLQ